MASRIRWQVAAAHLLAEQNPHHNGCDQHVCHQTDAHLQVRAALQRQRSRTLTRSAIESCAAIRAATYLFTIHVLNTNKEGWQGSQSLGEQDSRRTPWLTASAASDVSCNKNVAKGSQPAEYALLTKKHSTTSTSRNENCGQTHQRVLDEGMGGRRTCSERRERRRAEDDGRCCGGGGDLSRDSRREDCRSVAGDVCASRETAIRSAAVVYKNTDTTIKYAMLVEREEAVSDHCIAPAELSVRSSMPRLHHRGLSTQSQQAHRATTAHAGADSRHQPPANCTPRRRRHAQQRGSSSARSKCEPSATERQTTSSSIWRQ